MDERTGRKLDNFATIQGALTELLSDVAEAWCLDEEEIWSEIPDEEAQEITREAIQRACAGAKPEEVFAAINLCKKSSCASPDDFLTCLLKGSDWKGRVAIDALESRLWSLCDVLDDPAVMVADVLEPLVLWDESGVYDAGGHEYAETTLWISAPGIGLAQVANVGGDEFQVRECMRGDFDEVQRQQWLDTSVGAFLRSKDETESGAES
jgi:hypothetical protein